mmetsp:Transcript_8160/g.11921  ORF Transcript_8160/g.11921 Transcript_8160/m.11921 type:complete len:87 (+) Transcript_8160:716-976(+)
MDIKAQYWDPMWKTSYKKEDCKVPQVMDGLKISRGAANRVDLTKQQVEQAQQKLRAATTMIMLKNTTGTTTKKDDDDDSSDSEAED